MDAQNPRSLQHPVGIRVAQGVGIFGSSFLAGITAGYSFVAVPAIAIAPPDVLVRQWQVIFNIGAIAGPPLAVASASAYAWLAYSANQMDAAVPARLYTAATMLIPWIVPYTFMVMKPTNAKLEALADLAKSGQGAKVAADAAQALLGEWSRLHMVRIALTTAGAVAGVVATMRWTAQESPSVKED